MNRSGRFGRGWRLAKQSWAVLRDDRSLAIFPIISAFAIAAALLVIAGPGAVLVATDTAAPVAYVLWAIALYVLVYIGIYCNVALSAAAAKALDGHDTTLADGFSVARERRGVIAKWAAVQLTVGVLLNLLEAALAQTPIGRIAASIITSLLSGVWSIVTFFVLPLLALEGVGPKEALTRSGNLIKARWGEGFVGAGSIGLILALLVILPSAAIIALGVAAVGSTAALGGVLIAIGAIGVIAGILVSATLNTIFRVALYRYATDDVVAAGFDQDSLANAFRPRRGGRF